MEHVFALLQEAAEVIKEVSDARGRCLGVGTVGHRAVEIFKGNGFSQVVKIVLTVEHEVEADVLHIDSFKLFGGQIYR